MSRALEDTQDTEDKGIYRAAAPRGVMVTRGGENTSMHTALKHKLQEASHQRLFLATDRMKLNIKVLRALLYYFKTS